MARSGRCCRWPGWARWSGGEHADLYQVVGEDSEPGPGPGSLGAVQAGAVPSVLPLEGADPAFAAGSPLDGAPERGPPFGGLAGLAGFALAGDHHVADSEPVQVLFDGFLAVVAVSGDGPGLGAGPLDDPCHGRGELRAVGRVALLDGVVEDDPVVVVGDLGLVPELDGLAETALGDGPGILVMQADPPGRPGRHVPGQPLPGLRGDRHGHLQQPGQVIDRPA